MTGFTSTPKEINNLFNIGRDMGKLGLSLGSNVKGAKSIFNKKKEKFAHKKVAKKTAVDKSPVEKTSKVYTKGQKGSKLGKSSSTSANKGHKQLEDADSDMEEEEVVDNDAPPNFTSSFWLKKRV